VTGTLLVPGQDKLEVRRVVDRVKDGQDGTLNDKEVWRGR